MGAGCACDWLGGPPADLHTRQPASQPLGSLLLQISLPGMGGSTHRRCRPPARPAQVLMVVEQPQREEGEAGMDYAKRLQNERVLALNPNYSFE